MHFIKDEEINFIDKRDCLGGQHYADTLVKAIKEAPSDKTFTIGLFGEWGIGKSSIVSTAKKQLESKNSDTKFIEYDAWKYSGDSFKRMFLLHLADELKIKKTKLFERFYKIGTEKKLNHSVWIGVAIVLIILTSTAIFLNQYLLEVGIISFLTYISKLFIDIINMFTETTTIPLAFAPEQFHECFDEIILCRLKNNKRANKKEYNWVSNPFFQKKQKKLVIIVDNLDRSNYSEEILYDIKNFMSNYNNLIFIIPIDHYELCKNRGYANHAEKLRKIFNLEIRIKPLEDGEIFEFAKHLNIQNKLGFSNEVLAIISDRYATNPRRIIHFFNDLSAELELIKNRMKPDEIKEHQDLICKALVIREEWPDYYKAVVKNPKLLTRRNIDDSFSKGKTEALESLNSFLSYTHKLSSEPDIEVLQKVVSNRKYYDKILPEVVEAIRLGDFAKLTPHLATDRSLIIDKIISYSKLNFDKNVIKLSVNQFELLTLINKEKELSKHEMNKIQEIFQNDFKEILSLYDEAYYEELASFINLAQSMGIDIFSKACHDYIKMYIDGSPGFPKSKKLFGSLITQPQISNIIKNDSDLFHQYYNSMGKSIDFKSIPNIKNLYSDQLATHCISKFSTYGGIDFDNFIYLMQIHKIPDNIINTFFAKILNSVPSYQPAQKDKIILLMKSLIPLIDTKYMKNDSHLNQISERIFLNNQWNSIITDSTEEERVIIKDFLLKINTFSSTISIPRLFTQNTSDEAHKMLLEIADEASQSGKPLNQYWPILSKIKRLDSTYINLLYKISEEKSGNNTYSITDQNLKIKTDQIFKENNIEDVNKTLKIIPKNSRLYMAIDNSISSAPTKTE